MEVTEINQKNVIYSLMLVSLAILSLFAAVAARRFSAMSFSEGDLMGSFDAKKRDSCFKWGSWNDAPLATITVKTTRTFTGVSTITGQQVTTSFSSGEYWVNGKIAFKIRIRIGERTPIIEFDVKFIDKNKDPTSLFSYRIFDTEINDIDFYARRISKKTYEIFCYEVDLYTAHLMRDPEPDIVCADVTWSFTAIINV